MIVVTGAAGFIGSNIVADLEADGQEPIVAVDWFETGDKWRNLAKRRIAAFVQPDEILSFLDRNAKQISHIIHMGAISATTERDVDRLVRWNINYTVALWDWCALHGVAFLYASSAATYGSREAGLHDDDSVAGLAELRPLNAYGWSKKATDDIFAMRVARGDPRPPQWLGLKFFNVYGPNEYHKGDMMSVAAKMYDTVMRGENVRLFRSHRGDIADGEQKRDFIYVKDCTRVIAWLMSQPHVNGIFNLGTGRAQAFVDIGSALQQAVNRKVSIDFVEMPQDLRDRYQYFTEATMTKLRSYGYDRPFMDLQAGIADYVSQHLAHDDRFR